MLEAVLKRVLQAVFGGGSDISADNPLEVHDPKVGSLISFEGTTTGDGAGDGSTLVCSDLTTKPDYDGHWVVVTSGDYAGQATDITGATTGGTVNVHENFDGQILEGTKFVILAMKALPAEVAAIEAKLDKTLFCMDFWSAPLEGVTLTDIAAPGTDVALPDVEVDLPAGATVVRAVAMFKFRMLDNPGAANALQGDQYIGVQKGGAGGYANAIFLDDNMFGIAEATREGGDVVVGNLNVVAKVDGDATYNLQWTASLVDVANLKFCDVQTGIRVWYSV